MRDGSLRWITVFGLGHQRPASGTWGSLPPVLLAAFLFLAGVSPASHAWAYLACTALLGLIFAAACIAQSDRAVARFGEDPAEVVADEMAGMSLTLLFIPAAAVATPALAAFSLLYAFIAFRVMDIFKPWPAGRAQQIPGGWGILLDDLFAGLYAGLVVLLIARFILPA